MAPTGNGPDPITVVRLPLPHPGSDPVRLLMTRLGSVDLGLTDELHASSAPRPYAVARGPGVMDVVAFRDDLARALLASGEGARLVTRQQIAPLAEGESGGRVLRLAFLAPTHFRVAGLDHLLPDPFHVFGGLMERWQDLGWPAMAWPNLKRIAVAPETLRVAEMPIQAGQQRRGFVGVSRCDLLGLEREDQAVIWRLARFGEWRGVGAHTSYGMGRLRILGLGGSAAQASHVWSEETSRGGLSSQTAGQRGCPGAGHGG